MSMKTKEEVKKVRKPLTRLATLATLSPGERAANEVWSRTEAMRENAKIEGAKPECL
jgi:hypothetical protein